MPGCSIDVALHPSLVGESSEPCVVVLLDVLCATTTATLALDSGRAEVRIAAAGDGLQPPGLPTALAHVEGADVTIVAPDLVAATASVAAARPAAELLVGSLAGASALVEHLAVRCDGGGSVTFVCVGREHRTAVENVYAAGVLARMLLMQVDDPPMLGDDAGIAVSVAGTHVDHEAALASGEAGRKLVTELPASVADIEICARTDLCRAIGCLEPVGGDGPRSTLVQVRAAVPR